MNLSDDECHGHEQMLCAQECVVTSSGSEGNDEVEVECTETDVHGKAAVQRTWAEVAVTGC